MTRRLAMSIFWFFLAVLALPGAGPRSASAGHLAAAEADFYVATNGNDQWSGRLAEPKADKSDGPVATVKRAQQLVRQMKDEQPQRDRAIVVAIRGGTYSLAEPIKFGPEDSGTEKAPVVYQTLGDERPILSGGRTLTGWQVDGQGRWSVELPETKDRSWSFTQLFVNDQRRYRPRMPKQGYCKIAKQVPPSPELAGKAHDRFGFAEKDIDAGWANLEDVEIVAFHSWTASRLRVAKVDPAEKVVTLRGNTPGKDWWAQFVVGHRFFADNVREALSSPGEWYLDHSTGRLTYIPQPGETPDKTVVVAPRLQYLLLLGGDLNARRWVQHVQFRGLTFAHANWAMPLTGQAFPQAEINLGSAVAAFATRNVTLTDCAVRHVGEYALAFGRGCKNNRVEGCELFDLGAGGVKIGHALPETWGDHLGPPADDEAHVTHQTIRNCRIAHGGRLHSAAIGVWIGHSAHNTVEHNDICDFYYSGLSVGWVWGYSQSHAHHNDIGFNHVYQIGQGVLSDMGGIYTLGVSPGTVIHDNRFHDVKSFDYGGWGLYTDEGSTGVVMKNNLVYRCSRASFHQHYGKENRVENNILAFAGEQQLQRTRTEPHTSFFFERNIVYWDNGSPLLGANWKDNNFRMDNNLYFHVGEKPSMFPENKTFEQWQKERSQDQHSLIADPSFVDAKKDDFHLKPDSPALKLGFQPFDYTKAGRQTPPKLTAGLPPAPKAFE